MLLDKNHCGVYIERNRIVRNMIIKLRCIDVDKYLSFCNDLYPINTKPIKTTDASSSVDMA